MKDVKQHRIHQGVSFAFDGFEGQGLVALSGLVERGDSDIDPDVLFLELDDGQRFRFFLDAGLAFWKMGTDPAIEVDESTRFVDYVVFFGLARETIASIEVRPSGPEGFAKLTIRFESGRALELVFVDESDIDSPTVIREVC